MRRLIVFLSLVLLVAPAFAAGEDMRNFRAENARVNSNGGAALAAASGDSPAALRSYLRGQGRSQALVDSLVTVRESEFKGRKTVELRQQVNGLEVVGAYAKANFNSRGELVHSIDGLVEPAALRRARINGDDAVTAAIDNLHPGNRADSPFFYRAPNAERVAIALNNGSMTEGFRVETWTADSNELNYTFVDGNGRILGVESRTNTDSYNVFVENPSDTNQGVQAGPGSGNAESPNGWLAGSQTTFNIRGNNVSAYLDTTNNNSPDPGGSTVTDGNFLTNWSSNSEPETTQNKEVAVQTLFWANNVIHDKLYRHGFIESARNFQNDNFGNGGNGGDAVNAEAQDGSGTNNANFSTPNDGSPGRMQMYVWTYTSPKRDGDLESDIVYHEYGHGLTWRMIGSMSGAMSGAIGEGMSDVLALYMNEDDVVGEYSTNDPVGIRSEPYTNYSRTYGDFGGNSVHFDGEIYAATMWRLRDIFLSNNIAMDTLWDYMIGGMNSTPAGPAMEDMRDGILAAAAGTGHECLIWDAFAQFGIGEGASASVKGGGPFGGSVTVNESFQLPAACSSCTPNENPEVSCNDGIDNDCDGFVDSADADCGGSCGATGTSCSNDADCCTSCSGGKPGTRTCR